MAPTKLIAVGAVACDILLGVPHFPAEDSKLRTTSFHKRRGGNVGNSFEVLQQLLVTGSQQKTGNDVELVLVAALPARASPSIDFIASSFQGTSPALDHGKDAQKDAARPLVDMSHCLYRDGYDEPVTSYIISSEAKQTRTIVNHNPLPEMAFEEFVQIVDSVTSSTASRENGEHYWFHFEGRIPATTLRCMRHLRSSGTCQPREAGDALHTSLMISVELEKPGREGLQDLAYEANLIFYSRSWAEGEGYGSAEECLRHQAKLLNSASECHPQPQTRLLICTWGASGACGLLAQCNSEPKDDNAPAIVHSPARHAGTRQIVDTTGAGDAFIATMLSILVRQNASGSRTFPAFSHDGFLKDALASANALAGRKILQHGFQGLGSEPSDGSE